MSVGLHRTVTLLKMTTMMTLHLVQFKRQQSFLTPWSQRQLPLLRSTNTYFSLRVKVLKLPGAHPRISAGRHLTSCPVHVEQR